MFEKLCEELSQHTKLSQYDEFDSIATKHGFEVSKLYRGENHRTDNHSGKHEVWVSYPEASVKAGWGSTLEIAVEGAVQFCHRMNSIKNP